MSNLHITPLHLFLLSLILGLSSCINPKESPEVNPEISSYNESEDLVTKTILAQKLDSLFNYELDRGEYLGAGVSVVMDGKIVYEKGFGYRDVEKRSKVDVNSLFRIGSLSKAFTGTLTGILVQNKDLDLELPVVEKVPQFKLKEDSLTNNVRLKHLLSHSAGFPYHSYTNLVESNLTMREIIPYFKEIDDMKKSGEVYSYQNAAFAVSGEVISSALKRDIRNIYHEEMFDPLNMCMTSLDYESIKKNSNVALPHSKTKNGWTKRKLNQKYYNAIPAGGINTNTSDVSKFLLALVGENPEIINYNALAEITSPRISTNVSYRYYTKWPDFLDSSYGTGWRIHRFQKEEGDQINTLYHHGGMVNNYRSEMAFNYDDKIAMCVMFNSYSSFSKNVVPRVMEIIAETQCLVYDREVL